MKTITLLGIKILVTGTRGIPGIQGGIETHCEELYPRIAGLGCGVIITRRKSYVKDNLTEFKGITLKNICVPKSKHFEAIIHTLLSTFYAKWKGCHVIHIHGIGPSLCAPFARFLGLKVIVTNHGPDYKRQKWGKISSFILRLGELLGVAFAHKVIAVSPYIVERLKSMYKCGNCVRIPNGITIQKRIKKDVLLKKYGLKKNSFILSVGRFVPEKGFHDLIASYSKFKNTGMKLVIVGKADHETSYSRRLKKTARENGCVLTGFIQKENLAQLYSHARLFILPSYHEGLPLSLLEALSYDLDVLVSDIPAHVEIGLDTSSYFKAGDVGDLVNKISNKFNFSGTSKNNGILLSQYNWDAIAAKTGELYALVKRGG